MGKFTRIIALGLGAGVGVSLLSESLSGMVEAFGFHPDSKAGTTLSSAVAAGVGVFVAEAVLSRV